jgi:mannitol/fructose-specific phosphotransferase system IIA component (Ntr-type)
MLFSIRRNSMTPQEQITKMTTAIRQAIKVMGDRFGSTEQDVARAIQELKASMQTSPEPSLSSETLPRPAS